MSATAAGNNHTLVLSTTGTVYACGLNRFGQLGDGTLVNRASPVQVTGAVNANVVAISAGWDHSLALSTAGTLYAWGDNRFGQLGNGNVPTGTTVPVAVAFPVGTPAMTAIAAGAYFSLSLDNTGQVWAWGYSGNGEAGQSARVVAQPAKVTIPGNPTIQAIAAGADHSLALTSAGAVFAWGLNNYGQLGCGACAGGPVPVAVATSTVMTAIAAGGMHSLAITGGSVISWGRNNKGQLGNGTLADSSTPTTITLSGLPAPTATAIAAGWQHSLALTNTGAVQAWGSNANGQVGCGCGTVLQAPVAVALNGTGIVNSIGAGYAHSVAVQ